MPPAHREPQCNQPQCVAKRAKVASLAAALAVTRRAGFVDEARAAIQDIRRVPADERAAAGRVDGVRRQRVNEPDERGRALMQSGRLKGLRAEVLLTGSDANRRDALLLGKLRVDLVDATEADAQIDDDRAAQLAALGRLVDERTREVEPLQCAVCFESFADGDLTDLYLGDGCYHPFHASCVRINAQHNARRNGDHREFFDETGQILPTMANRFPAGGFSVACPLCRDSAFADHASWAINERALAILAQEDAGGGAADDADASVEDRLVAARTAGHLVLLRAPNGATDPDTDAPLAILVEAHTPGTKSVFDFFALTQSQGWRALGYTFDREGELVGGKAWYRAMHASDPSCDAMPVGATIRRTSPQYYKAERPGADRKMKSSGGVYKIDLPRVVPVAVAAVVEGAPPEA